MQYKIIFILSFWLFIFMVSKKNPPLGWVWGRKSYNKNINVNMNFLLDFNYLGMLFNKRSVKAFEFMQSK